jgi:hypothetical protein
MDREWMRQRLVEYLALCEEWQSSLYRPMPPEVDISSQIISKIPTVKEILKRLDPDLIADVTDPLAMGGLSKVRVAIDQALGILRDRDDWKTMLDPDAPSYVADQFHSDIWTAASAIWDTGHYRVAVQQAAVSLSAHIAAKAGSSLTERELVQLVFAPADPPKGQTRLHLPGDKASKTWRSRQDGLHLLAQGAFAGIRNVATHTSDEWTEQEALENLAVLSVVARWSDETVLVTPA